MLRRRLLNLPSACRPRFYSLPRSRDARLLSLVESFEPFHVRVTEALHNNFFALAALFVSNEAETLPQANILRQIVRGLSVYDPRLVPINLRALRLLHRKMKLQMDSVEKAILIDTLIEYRDPEIIRSGLSLLSSIEGGPIPVSALMAICAHAKTINSPSTLEHLWYYLRDMYPRTVFQYTSLMVDFLEIFSRNERYRPMARQVAQACLGGELNPSIILGIAKASYMLKDDVLAAQLCSRIGVVDSKINSVLSQLDAAKGRKLRHDVLKLSAQEMSGVVKGAARRNIALGEQLVEDSSTQANHTKYRMRLAKTALCNQYIHEGDFEKFMNTFRELQALQLGSGILLNLRITWELHHGTFETAKRHYQNWDRLPIKQRAIALKALESMALNDESALQWTKAEKCLHGLR